MKSRISSESSLQKSKPCINASACFGLWFTLAAAILYVCWLGWHWLPLDFSDKELAAFVSRVWDVKRELDAGHGLPWWTPFYMSGSSYGLNHSQGLYLLPSVVLAHAFSIPVAVKLTALAAIVAGAVAMYFCARYFLKNEWAAALAAMAFLLHPEQIIRAAGVEHLGIIVFMPFMPLTFWLFARALETGRFRDTFWCALAMAGMLWAHNKMAFVHGVFLAGYLVFWLWPAERRRQWKAAARACGLVSGLSLAIGAAIVMPGIVESKHVKLLSGESVQLAGWQRSYAFKSLLGVVDRNGAVTRAAWDGVRRELETGTRFTTREDLDGARRVANLQMEAPEKYAGLVALALIAVTAIFNRQRANGRLFWFAIVSLMVSVMLATGPATVAGANWKTWESLASVPGVPAVVKLVPWALLAMALALFVLFWRRKLTTTRRRIAGLAVLAGFLFLPAFQILAAVPFFKEIRSPFVFYDGPGTFFVALLVGFFVTDVTGGGLGGARPTNGPLERGASPRRIVVVVGAVALLMLLDYWPYQRPCKDNGVPARTLANLRAAYESLRADPDWVKTYSLSGRYFHLLGPMYGGKPQVYEAFYNWMAPLGTGLLNQQGEPEMGSLLGARYILCDKTDPQMDARPIVTGLRQRFPVAAENEDFTVFRNDAAHPYITGYARSCLFVGDVRESARLALTLAARGWPLVHADAERPGNYAKVYWSGDDMFSPGGRPSPVTLSDVQLTRISNEEIHIEATAPAACLAVIAESYYPFWRAEVDGQPTEVLRVSTALMGLELPAGAHRIVLHYRPPRAYAIAGIVSLLSFVVGFGATILPWRAGRR